MSTNQLIHTEQLAAQLQVPRTRIQAWAREGRIPAYRAGRRFLFDPDEVKEVMRRRAREVCE